MPISGKAQCSLFTMWPKMAESSWSCTKLPALLNEDEAGRIDSRLEAIGDCTLIFIMQIGASAAARVTRRKIMPVKVPFGSPIDEQVKRLVEMLQGKPPMWLAKVLRAEEEGEGEGLDGTHG